MPLKVYKLIFSLLAVLLLTPWTVAFAQSNAADRAIPVQVEAAEPSAAPSWQAFGRTIGGVDKPGDLYYIDGANCATDLLATLYLTNTNELCHGYRYLTLKVGLYAWSNNGEWQPAVTWDGEPNPETYLTLRNGQVSFILTGYTRYKVTIDDGCFYTAYAGNSFSPQFYLTVEQA